MLGETGIVVDELKVEISISDKEFCKDFILAYNITKYILSFGKNFIPVLA